MPAPAYAIDAIQTPLPAQLDTWHVTTAPPLSVTYSFENGPSSQFSGSYSGWSAWTPAQMDAVRWGLHEYESVINVRFVEVAAGSPDPDIVFGRVSLTHGGETWWSYSYQTDANGQVTSKTWDASVVFANDYDMTNYGFRNTILHEIGHAMLLKHPGDYDSTGNHPPPPYLPAAEDNVDYSVMSYNWASGGAPGYQLELYDIAALQARWGANTSSETGDNTYTFAQDQGGVFAIWDTGGVDTIDETFAGTRVSVDLNEGTFSKLGTQDRISIAWGVTVENAKGGAYNDTLTGNAGDNQLTGNGGADVIDGGAGVDTAIYSGARADYSWSQGSDGAWTVFDTRGVDGADTLRNVEFLRFTDVTVDITSASPNPPADPNAGRVYTSPGPGSAVSGGAGDDTIYASQGPDVLTGGAGNDVFVWAKAPWSPAKVTDFEQGHDRIDLSALFAQAGYTGADPVADGYIRFVGLQDGTGIIFDSDGRASGDQWGTYIIDLQGMRSYQANWGVIAGGQTPATFSLQSQPVGVQEGNSGLTAMTFTITRSGSTAAAGTVTWSVYADPYASAQVNDFAPTASGGFPSGQAQFAVGETSKTITVNVIGDTNVEPDEAFWVRLLSSTGGSISEHREAQGLILNDDHDAPPPGGGQVYTSAGPGSTIVAGDGNDTINASQGSDVLTGGAGDDVFAWAREPWSPARITDFAVGHDRLDFSRLFSGAGYTGTDPVADRYIMLIDDGAGGTKVLFDHDGTGPSPEWANYVLQLEHVPVAGLTWAQLAGAATPPPAPGGQTLTSAGPGSTLTGGAGDDTLIGSRGSDTLTGGAGADRFVFPHENWSPATITDFHPGEDKVDLRGVLDDWAYGGADPIGDGHVILLADSAGTKVLLDHDGPGGDWGNYVLLIQGVQPGQLAASDFLFQ